MSYMKRSAILTIVMVVLFATIGFQQADSIIISSPAVGQTVSGVVVIEGSAARQNFQYYKIEIAEGSTPADDAWRLLNDQTYDQPIMAGSLEGWDTTQYPNGVYSLRLRVVDITGNYSEVIVPSISVQNTTSVAESESEPDSAPPPKTMSVEASAQELETFNEIVGAVYDAESSQLLLVGRFNPDLPAETTLLLDDLVMALRVIYEGEFPAVSIDPGDDINVMEVKYFGNTEGTGLAWTMFEADRLLKVYSMGLDNNTNQSVTSNVPGYKSELDLTSPSGTGGGPALWHRIWFEADDSEAAAVKQSNDGQAILFDQAHMVVETEYISFDGSPVPNGSDPAADAFVKHFNENFEAFAAEQSVFHRLNQIHRFLIIARWLRDQETPLDKLWISEYEDQPVETPTTTPRRAVTRDLGLYILTLGGGVDFFAENNYSPGNPEAGDLADALFNIPSTNGHRQGEIMLNGDSYNVATFPTRQQSYYIETNEAGNQWYVDNQTGNPLTYISADGMITNFDEYDEDGRPVVITTHQSQNKRIFIYDNGTLDSIRYENELDEEVLRETFLADIQALLAREVGNATVSDQNFNLLAQNNLPPMNWITLEDSEGIKERVWSVTVQGESQVVKELNSDTQLNSTDLIQEITLDGRRFGVFGGETGSRLHNRRLVFQHSTNGTNFAYIYQLNGNIAVQYGRQPEIIITGLMPDQLDDVGNPDLSEDERLEILAGFDGIITGEGDEILFSGQYPDTSEGNETKNRIQQINKGLAIGFLSTKGLLIKNDDDPVLARNNLAAQQAIGNGTSPNAELVVFDESLSESQRVVGEQIKVIANENNIPVRAGLTEVGENTNIVVVTAHANQDLESIINEAGQSGALKDKLVILAQCGRDGNRDFATALVKQHNASAVILTDGFIDIEAVRATFLEFVSRRDIAAYQAWFEAIQTLIESDTTPESLKIELQRLLESTMVISQAPLSNPSGALG